MIDETWTNARGGGKARVIECARGLHPSSIRASVHQYVLAEVRKGHLLSLLFKDRLALRSIFDCILPSCLHNIVWLSSSRFQTTFSLPRSARSPSSTSTRDNRNALQISVESSRARTLTRFRRNWSKRGSSSSASACAAGDAYA